MDDSNKTKILEIRDKLDIILDNIINEEPKKIEPEEIKIKK